MPWYKIIFTDDETFSGEPLKVAKQAQQMHQAAGLPKEFAIFAEIDEEARYVHYFSPTASTVCANLVSSLGGVSCLLPAHPMPSFGMEYGNPEEAWALVKRDKPATDQREARKPSNQTQTAAARKEEYIKIDPRDFIHSPFVACPKCERKEFGILGVQGDRYIRRCRTCWHTQHFWLPKITKKVIYLDQNAISNMMKALNPQMAAHQKGRVDLFWRTLFEKLDILCKLQLIICPDSTAHSNESRVSNFFQALWRMYEHLSHGVSFRDPTTIKRFQLYEHLGNILAGAPQTELELNVHEVVSGTINEWTDHILITADIPWRPEWIVELRQYRKQLATEIEAVFEKWRRDTDKTFDDWFIDEVNAFGKTILHRYLIFEMTVAKILSGEGELDLNVNPLLPPPPVMMVRTILERFRTGGITETEIGPKTLEYLTSPAMKELPFLKISSLLWAAVARKAAGGQRRPPTRGMSNDIETISTLLPYCDAMFLDKECWAYLHEEPLRRELTFGTKLFSLNNKQGFLDYLDAIKLSASPDHLAVVQEVYGDEQVRPYSSMYHQKES